MERLSSGDLKDCLRYEFENSRHWSDEMWKSRMAGGGGNKKRFQYCTDPSGQEMLYLRAFQGHSGRNPIDPSLQDNVLIPNNFSEFIKDCRRYEFENSRHWSDEMWRVEWQEAEETRKYFHTALIHQDKKCLISELFKVIQDAIPLILHCRTMC